MEHSSRLIIACPLAKFEGQAFSRWPLHITLLHWFYIHGSNLGALKSSLHEVAASTAPIAVEVGHMEMFGVDRDVAVDTIVPNPQLLELHTRLLGAVADQDGRLEAPQWCGDNNYRAHITRQESKYVEAGRILHIGGMALVEAIGDNPIQRRVHGLYTISQ